jgi:hypothetical protein
VPLSECGRLLANRAVGLAISNLEGTRATDESLARHAHKAALACGDVRLLAADRYVASLRTRLADLESSRTRPRSARSRRRVPRGGALPNPPRRVVAARASASRLVRRGLRAHRGWHFGSRRGGSARRPSPPRSPGPGTASTTCSPTSARRIAPGRDPRDAEGQGSAPAVRGSPPRAARARGRGHRVRAPRSRGSIRGGDPARARSQPRRTTICSSASGPSRSRRVIAPQGRPFLWCELKT